MWLEAFIAYKINTDLVKINLISDKERISLLLQLMEVNSDRIL
jgi:predicted transport protein